MAERVLMLTTSSAPGLEVEEYLGPVSAQVVVGTGLLTDVLSAFTDFFGAASKSYESKLDGINEGVLKRLEEKCQRRGGNAILGLRVDHDEISGNGKSMLMVTASGTATKLRSAPEEVPRGPRSPGALRAEDLGNELRRRSIIAGAAAGRIPFDEEGWAFIRRTPIPEIGAAICSRVQQSIEASVGPADDWRHTLGQYMESISAEDAAALVFEQIEVASDHLFGLLLAVAIDKRLMDFTRAIAALSSETERLRRRAAQLLRAEPAEYSLADATAIRDCAARLEQSFPKARPYTDRVGLMKTERLVWKCACDKTPSADIPRCPSCGRDGYGFTSTEVDIGAIVVLLRDRARAIEDVLRT